MDMYFILGFVRRWKNIARICLVLNWIHFNNKYMVLTSVKTDKQNIKISIFYQDTVRAIESWINFHA